MEKAHCNTNPAYRVINATITLKDYGELHCNTGANYTIEQIQNKIKNR